MAHNVEVLILTSDFDFATDRVCRDLAARGTRFLRLNRERLADTRLVFDPLSAELTCYHDGDAWLVDDALKSIWWRQGTFDRNVLDRGLSIKEQLAKSQWSAFMRSMMAFQNPRWINHPAATYQAETKAVQLSKAKKIGFDVPSTLMTNDPRAPVASRVGNRIALKSIDTLLLRDDREQLFGYTTILDWADVADEHLRAAPVTTQTALSGKLDLRVTVLGEDMWCVAIRNGGGGIEGDWRLTTKNDLEIEPYSLPDDVTERCRELVGALGLTYGAIDLALADERYWFIEINPTGEWGWLDGPERPIAASIAEHLTWAS